jgi:hypothetical protein
MSFLSRIASGAVRAISAPFNIAKTAVNAVISEAKTIGSTFSEIGKGNYLSAASTLIGGTVKNAVGAGVDMALDSNPVTAFVHGAVTDNTGWTGTNSWMG